MFPTYTTGFMGCITSYPYSLDYSWVWPVGGTGRRAEVAGRTSRKVIPLFAPWLGSSCASLLKATAPAGWHLLPLSLISSDCCALVPCSPGVVTASKGLFTISCWFLAYPSVNIPFIQKSAVTLLSVVIFFCWNPHWYVWLLAVFKKMKHIDHRIKPPKLIFNSLYTLQKIKKYNSRKFTYN